MASKCVICKKPATKKVIWADGRAYQPSCDEHVKATQDMLTAKNKEMTELAGVQDLSEPAFRVLDLVSSRVYPGLERKPGGPDNWVEAAGGLPSYIERIAKHLHYERGMTISHAIASAVNTVKRWARMGKVAKYGDPLGKRVSPKTAALAIKALAQWEAKKKAGSLALSEEMLRVIDMTEVSEEFALDLAEEMDGVALDMGEGETGAESTDHAILLPSEIELPRGMVDVKALAERAGRIEDPARRAAARQAIVDLAGFDAEALFDLASTIPPRNARGRAKDGRKSFKGQGKWKHGFVPANRAAKEAKAKGSPIAMKRMNRLFGKDKAKDDARKQTREVQSATGRAGQRSAGGRKASPNVVKVDEKSHPGSERASDIGHLRRTPLAGENNRNTLAGGKDGTLPGHQKEASKSTRIPERARQNWDEIPESLKTLRNGKRYVLAEFGGKQYVTEWIGGIKTTESSALKDRKVMRTLSSADAANMSASELRALVNNPRTPEAVKKSARLALRSQAKESK